MSRERLYRVEAIVLKRTDIGEADRLLTLYTPDRGKLRAVAKGVRKITSRKGGHVELFTHATLLLAKGHDLDVVTQADTLDAYIALRDHLDRVGYAYYFAELVDQFTEEAIENVELFDLLKRALAWLGDATIDAALLARWVELRLTSLVGYRPEMFECVNCGKPLEPVENSFSADAGGMLDPTCALAARDALLVSLNALKVLRYLQTRGWETVRTLRLAATEHAEVEKVMLRHIEHHLERNLKSVEFLRTLRFGTTVL